LLHSQPRLAQKNPQADFLYIEHDIVYDKIEELEEQLFAARAKKLRYRLGKALVLVWTIVLKGGFA